MSGPVVVCNAFPDDNKGGSAITQQTIAWLERCFPASPVFLIPVEQDREYDPRQHRFTLQRYPDVRVLPSPIREGASGFSTARALLRSLWMLWKRPGHTPFERTITSAEVVVSKGGFVFVERHTVAGLLGLWFTAFPLVYATRKGVRTVVLCSTIGPFRSAWSRALSRWILKRVEIVVTRDPISTGQARGLGCTQVLESPDITLAFGPAEGEGSFRAARAGQRFGVLVISAERRLPDEDFLGRLREVADRLLSEAIVETVVVVVQSIEDAGLSSRFVEACRDPRITLLADDLAPEELIEFYGDAEFVISKRLHAGLFALLAGTPILLFSTDGVKADGIMKQLGLGDRLLPYPGFSVDEALRRIREIQSDHRREVERIQSGVDRARRELEEVLGGVAEMLRSAPATDDRVQAQSQ